MVHLLALASAKNVSDIHALPVHPSSAQLFSGEVRIILKPNRRCLRWEGGVVLPQRSGSVYSFNRGAACSCAMPGSCGADLLCFLVWSPQGQTCHKAVPFPLLGLGSGDFGLSGVAVALIPPEAWLLCGLCSWEVDLKEICAAADCSTPLTIFRFYVLDVSALCEVRAVSLP